MPPNEQPTSKKRIAKYKGQIIGEILYAENIKEQEYFVVRIPSHLINQEIEEQSLWHPTDSNNLPGNTVEFNGSGREILELLKKALCGFNNVYVVNAFLHPHHGFADEGRAVLHILINIPDEKKWIDIYYDHHEAERIPGGYGKISYIEHYYHREPFPEDNIKRYIEIKFTWGYSSYTGEYILNEILERKKCR